MTNPVKAVLAVAVVVVGVGAAIALSGGDDDASPGDTTTSSTASAVTAPTVTTSTAPISSGGCSPAGSWRLDDESFFEGVEALQPGQGDFEYVSGDYFVTFGANGAFTEVREAWRFRVTTPDGVIEVETSGDTTGTWTEDGGAVEIVADESNTTGSMWILEGDTPVPLPIAGGDDIGIPGFVGRGTVECVPGVLSLNMEADTGILPVLFDPVG